MPCVKDIAWKFVIRLEGEKWRCPYCEKEYLGKVTRVKSHFLAIPNRGISCCTKVPEYIRELMRWLPNQVPDEADIAWRFVNRLEDNKWSCYHCNEVFFGDLTRVKGHLLRIPNGWISICPGVPDHVTTLMKSLIGEAAEGQSRETHGQSSVAPLSRDMPTEAEVAGDQRREVNHQFYTMEPQSCDTPTQANVAEEESREANGQFSTEPESCNMSSAGIRFSQSFEDTEDLLLVLAQEWAHLTSDLEPRFDEILAWPSVAQIGHGESISCPAMALAEAEPESHLHDLPDQPQRSIPSQMQINDQQTPAGASSFHYDLLPDVGNSNCLQDCHHQSQLQIPMDIDPSTASQHTSGFHISEAPNLELQVPAAATNAIGTSSSQGAREEVLSVRGELERIRAFLRVANSLEESDEEVKVWVKQLRNTAYDMEDALDEFSLILRHDHGVGITGLTCRMSCCIKNLKARYRVTSEIQRIHSRVKGICEGYRRLRHKFGRAQQDPSLISVDSTWQDQHKTDLVGIEKPKNELVARLLYGAHQQEVISVLGMGGLGKTTLVKQVYEEPEVKKHFTVYAWITLSRFSKIEEQLQQMLNQIMKVIRKPVPPGANTINSHWLKMIIKDLLQKRRYLIVLDDAWHINEWDAVKHALPNNGRGSRVIITTRNGDLASTSCKEFNGLVKNMEPLDLEQSWKLFCRKTFQGDSCPYYLEEICKYILRKCEGFPLAIVAISGVLATKDKQRIDEWDVVRRSLRAEIDGNDRIKNLRRVLSLSFNDLPHYLKPCFLHLSVFPEDHLIERRRLTRLWVAEGFVERKEGKTLQEVANEYFNELLNRRLLQVANTTTDGRVKLCRIHDFQREMITSKSRDQSFATIAKEKTDLWPDKVRRLSLHNSLQFGQQNRSLSHLRSLYMFRVDRAFIDLLLGCDIKLLNVLDMQATPLSRFPVQVVEWYLLRYLSFRHTEVKTIPASIGRLQNLETLDLKHTNVTQLPVEILKLQKLQHLLVYRYENISYSSYKYGFKALMGIGAMQSLQKLCYLEADTERNDIIMRELGKLTQLSRLGILKLRKEDGRALCSSIGKLTNLCAISMTSVEDDEILDLQHLTSPPQLLQRIYLRGRLERLPNWLATLNSLVKLHLRWSWLKDDPLVSLQNLPNLVHLELLQVYEGQTLCFKSKGFWKLRILGLDNFNELRSVVVEEGAMSCLEKLIIQRCKLLDKLPSGIEYLTKLKVLEFFDMPDELIKIFVRGEQDKDYKKVAHIPEVYYGYWRDGGWDVQSIERSAEGDASPRQGTSMRSSEFPPCWK